MGGLKERTLERIKEEGYKTVVIAVDNDEAGKSFAVKNMLKAGKLIIPEITSEEGEKIKDWNDLLKYNVKQEYLEYIFA
jgi:DNA primase